MSRRRRSVQVWPVVADLMMVLAMTGLVLAADERREVPEPTESPMSGPAQETSQVISVLQQAIRGLGGGEVVIQHDGTLTLSDDLVTFAHNGLHLRWDIDGETRMRRLCRALVHSTYQAGLRGLVLEIGGHADETSCEEQSECNGYYSGARAGRFADWLQQDGNCPGIEILILRPIAYAATYPIVDPATGERSARRRISLRLVPDYERLTRSSAP